MGNLLVRNGRIRVPRSKDNVMVRLNDYTSYRLDIQQAIFGIADGAWRTAGFAWTFHQFTARDQANESIQGRTFGDAQPTTYQENYFYIDFMRIQQDSAYQLNWQSSFRPDPSTYISIDMDRGGGILPYADIVHETGHAIGLAHEHQRLDRTFYVVPTNQTYYDGILGNGQQVGVQTTTQSVPFGPYDPDSVMHYPGTFQTVSGVPVGGTTQRPVFPDRPSEGDVYTAIFMYNEARIQNYIKSRNTGFEKQYLGENAYVPDEERCQEERLANLARPYQSRGNRLNLDVLTRTKSAVQSQLNQLARLRAREQNAIEIFSLQEREQDQNLLDWAKQNYDAVAARQQTITTSTINNPNAMFPPNRGQVPPSLNVESGQQQESSILSKCAFM